MLRECIVTGREAEAFPACLAVLITLSLMLKNRATRSNLIGIARAVSRMECDYALTDISWTRTTLPTTTNSRKSCSG